MIARRLCRFAATSAMLLLCFVIQTQAQKSADVSSTVKASISIESAVIAKQKPATVTVKIENLSGHEINLKSISSFTLFATTEAAIARKFSVNGDSYWSPVDLLNTTPLKLEADPKMLKKGVIAGRVPEAVIHFNANETKTFVLDLTRLNWNATMSSLWPRWSIFEAVPKGNYSLEFTIDSDGDLKSNEVNVTVE